MSTRVITFFSCLLFASTALLAQANYATITGVATDSAGGVIPKLAVTARNVETNVPRTVHTGNTGDFSVTNLSPGRYELTGQLEGFRTYKLTGIVLEIGQTLRADMRLEVGAVTESINVRAEVAALNTENGAVVGDVIVLEEIRDLPLESRELTDLALLVPGVVPMAEGGLGSGLNVGGARSESTNFYVDGFSDLDSRGGAAQVYPNTNSIQEFKMEVAGYSAEYGRMAGGIMNMVLRSGTNRFHGDIFEYVRNNVIDSRAFFDREKLKLNRHQFGATLLGPVLLPKIYNGRDRTFFLFSWESYRQNVGLTSLAQVPTLLERGGDFSRSLDQLGRAAVVRDPLAANSPFANNRIPAARFHPASVKLLDYYPLPNRSTIGNNYINQATDRDTWDSFVWKIDHRFDDKNSIAVRHQSRLDNTGNPFAGSTLAGFDVKGHNTGSLFGIDYTHLFTPTFLMEARGGFSRTDWHERTTFSGINVAAQLGLPVWASEPSFLGFPQIDVLGYAGFASHSAYPLDYATTGLQSGIKFTSVRGEHVRKWGFNYTRDRFNQPFANNIRGTYGIQDRWTQHAIGDFLLGMLTSSSRRLTVPRTYVRATNMGMFFSDDWKITRSLTLNLGVRYEQVRPPTERYDRMSNYVPELRKIVSASRASVPDLDAVAARTGLGGIIVQASDVGLPRSLVFADNNNLAPRAGFAWRPFGNTKTVVRGGYGIFYTGVPLVRLRTYLMTSVPFAVSVTYSMQAARPDLLTFTNPFPSEREAVAGFTVGGHEVDPATGYMQSYNLTVERDLGGSAVLEVGFVGSKGTHLGRQYNFNQPRRSINTYLAGFPLAQTRPEPLLGTMAYFAFNANSIYDAGQIMLRKRGRGGMFYRLGYTFSKSIDETSQISGGSTGGVVNTANANVQNPDDFRGDRGRADYDRRHVVTTAFSWHVPVGRGHRFLSGASGVAEALIGGWQLSGTGNFSSGPPFTVIAAGIDENLGESQRPNRLANGNLDSLPGQGKRGVDYSWFDRTAFENVPRCISVARGCPPNANGFLPFQFGNSGRNILDGPGYAYLNTALMKNFRFAEQRKLQFRLEAFNVLNRANFLLPNKAFNALNGGLISRVRGSGSGGPRLFQAMLKFEF